MAAIELSLCFNPNQEDAYLSELLKSSTDLTLSGLQVDIHPMLWEDYKQEITSMALHSRGSDLSQVGFPLTDDLIAMNALQPFSPQLLAKVGGENVFHPIVKKIAKRHESGTVWGVPWMVDPRALLYWKDMVESAKVNPETAFHTAEDMESTFQHMQAAGVESPWVLGTSDKFVIIHSIVSWVWGKGGDFISPEGKRAIFLEKPALDGMEAYFRLQQYTPNAGEPLSVPTAKRLFVERKAAVTLGPYGSLNEFLDSVSPEHRDRLGVALPPGPPLIAGSDLVFWRYSYKTNEAGNLLKALFSSDVQVKYAKFLGDLPVTQEALNNLAQGTDENVRTFITTLDKGRLFATTKFAGMLEIQLASALTGLWSTRAGRPMDGLRDALQSALEPVQNRFDMLNSA